MALQPSDHNTLFANSAKYNTILKVFDCQNPSISSSPWCKLCKTAFHLQLWQDPQHRPAICLSVWSLGRWLLWNSSQSSIQAFGLKVVCHPAVLAIFPGAKSDRFSLPSPQQKLRSCRSIRQSLVFTLSSSYLKVRSRRQRGTPFPGLILFDLTLANSN